MVHIMTCLVPHHVRLQELANGWGGRIITTQVYFSKPLFWKAYHGWLINVVTIDVLDGGMIVLAMYTLNIFHPGYLLIDTPDTRRSDTDSDIVLKEAKGDVIEVIVPAP